MKWFLAIRNKVGRLKGSEGFTLIELAVALAILGILVAIAVPTYLNVRNRSYDSEAKQTLGEIRAVVWSHYLEQGDWPDDIEAVGYDTTNGAYATERWEYTVNPGSNKDQPTHICAHGLDTQPTKDRVWSLTLQPSGTSTLEGPNVVCP